MDKFAILILIISVVGFANAHSVSDYLWGKWKEDYRKQYGLSEEAGRRSIWEKQLARVNEHNQRYKMGLETYKMGLNEFSDLSWEEFEKIYLPRTFSISERQKEPVEKKKSLNLPNDIPDRLDWRDKGVVTPVIQQVNQCLADKDRAEVYVPSYVELPVGDENTLLKELYEFGPISIGFNVQQDFVQYKSGIFSSPNCDGSSSNHGMLLIGYGTENGNDYWIIKNSWGINWGELGIGRVARNKNVCGIANFNSRPIVAKCPK